MRKKEGLLNKVLNPNNDFLVSLLGSEKEERDILFSPFSFSPRYKH